MCFSTNKSSVVTGVEVSPAEIKEAVAAVIVVNKDLLLEERYRVNGKRNLFLLYIATFL